MTPAQAVAYRALCAVYERDGRATLRDVAAEAGLPLTTIYERLRSLADDGKVEISPDGHRGRLRPTAYRKVRWVPLIRWTVRP